MLMGGKCEVRRHLVSLFGAEAWNEQIKQFKRGNDCVHNQIYLRSPLRKIDVLSVAEDFNSLCCDADKQSVCCLLSFFNCVCMCSRVQGCVHALSVSMLLMAKMVMIQNKVTVSL